MLVGHIDRSIPGQTPRATATRDGMAARTSEDLIRVCCCVTLSDSTNPKFMILQNTLSHDENGDFSCHVITVVNWPCVSVVAQGYPCRPSRPLRASSFPFTKTARHNGGYHMSYKIYISVQ